MKSLPDAQHGDELPHTATRNLNGVPRCLEFHGVMSLASTTIAMSVRIATYGAGKHKSLSSVRPGTGLPMVLVTGSTWYLWKHKIRPEV